MRTKYSCKGKIASLILTLLLLIIVLLFQESFAQKIFERVTEQLAKEKGCLSCHEGIAPIHPKMGPIIDALAKDYPSEKFGIGKGCAICHEGSPSATKKEEAHEGFIPNPGNMWVVSRGKGCGKCHSAEGKLKSIQTEPLPEPTGGEIGHIISRVTDPLGVDNHVYRMQRGLMSLEFGKASHTLMSNGIHPKGDYLYADFNMDDPDGPVPLVGSATYKQWIAQALKAGCIKRVEKALEIPSFDKGKELWDDPHKAAMSDMYRKQCARCHIWEQGRRKRGDLRAGGCSACHVLYTNDGYYEGNDPTIPKDEPGRMMKHELTIKIPAAQCTHCHTRGKRIGTTFVGAFEYDYKADHMAVPFNERGKPQDLLFTKDYIKVREDIHFAKGMQCIDCHTSLDLHGDGNIYPSTLYQVEIQCADCHGTPDEYPWELPVGYGTALTFEGARGIYVDELGIEYLITSRGNPRANLEKRGNKVILTSFFDDKEHEVTLLKDKKQTDKWKTKQGKVSMSVIHQHLEKLECYACHSTWAPQCYGCHINYDRRKSGTDWITTALRHDPYTGKQNITKTAGDIYENRGFLRWENPMLGINLKGKVSPVIPGCQVIFTYVDEEGNVDVVNKIFKTTDGLNAPTLAPVQPHSNTIPARTCEDCHTDPKAIGYGTAVSRSQVELDKKDEPVFVNNAEGFYGDIPGSKKAKWQVPKIPDFPYAWDQLVTRSGKQVQNMPHVEDRPLNQKERDLVEREGLCVGCHQYNGEKEWEDLIEVYEKADTPDKHNEMMEKAIKALFEKVKGGSK